MGQQKKKALKWVTIIVASTYLVTGGLYFGTITKHQYETIQEQSAIISEQSQTIETRTLEIEGYEKETAKLQEEIQTLESESESARQRSIELGEQISRIEDEIRTTEQQIEQKQVEVKARQSNVIYCKFEVSFYTNAADEGGALGASGEYVKPWVSIAMPKDIPFYSNVTIEGLGTFVNHDTGSYIQWTTDAQGNKVCRVDVCVSSKAEARRLGRFYANGYITLNK